MEEDDYKQLIGRIFGPDGYLKKDFGLEYRPEQEALALKFAEMFANNWPLLAEGGTGVGKSLAYLIPGIIWSMEQNRKFLVSTHTKNLQDQIVKKDLPFIREIFKGVKELKPYSLFVEKLWMGRNNYLCTTRLENSIKEYSDRDDQELYEELLSLREVCKDKNFDGIRNHVPFEVSDKAWKLANADSPECNSHACKKNPTCYYKKNKAELEKANIIIANHALIFQVVANVDKSGMASLPGGRGLNDDGIVFKDDMVVFDEGHTVPQVATDYFGASMNLEEADAVCNRAVAYCKINGPLAKTNVEQMKSYTDDLHRVMERFFTECVNKTYKKFEVRGPYFRLKKSKWTTPSYKSSLEALIHFIDEESSQASDEAQKALIQGLIDELVSMKMILNDMIELPDQDQWAYWMEASEDRKKVSLVFKPISVAELLNHYVFSRNTPVALTSATLTNQNGKMHEFAYKVGAKMGGVHTEEIIEKSPFNYDKNMEVFISEDCPEFDIEDPRKSLKYESDALKKFIETMPDGGTLILCTSYDQCKRVGEQLRKSVKKRKILIQDPGSDRPELIRKFKEFGNAVLVGTQSFWTGVDVQGKALSQVIIMKMPFESPVYPLTKAKYEIEEAKGHFPFFTLSVPNAITVFRQGLGRLIRSANDKGRLVIMDSRLVNKSYGKEFFKVIPTRKFTLFNESNQRTKIKKYEV